MFRGAVICCGFGEAGWAEEGAGLRQSFAFPVGLLSAAVLGRRGVRAEEGAGGDVNFGALPMTRKFR